MRTSQPAARASLVCVSMQYAQPFHVGLRGNLPGAAGREVVQEDFAVAQTEAWHALANWNVR
jgi:hypothetical protein